MHLDWGGLIVSHLVGERHGGADGNTQVLLQIPCFLTCDTFDVEVKAPPRQNSPWSLCGYADGVKDDLRMSCEVRVIEPVGRRMEMVYRL